MDSDVYYFDVLPLRPRPKSLESLTSYLIRLAYVNGISTIADLTTVFFPSVDDKTIHTLSDLPMEDYGELPTLAQIDPGLLCTLTLHPVLIKFDRLGSPTTQGTFLAGSTARHLRFCPICLGNDPYYHLPWRFLKLQGCHKHGCQLLDHCGHCGATIRLLPKTLRIGVCPSCSCDLSACPAPALTDADRLAAHQQLRDLEFLLKPDPKGTKTGQLRPALALAFSRMRQPGGMSVAELARASGLPHESLHKIEQAGSSQRGARLSFYHAYADHFGMGLQDLFDVAQSEPNDRQFADSLGELEPKTSVHQVVLDSLIAQIREIVERRVQKGQIVTRHAVLKTLGSTLDDVPLRSRVRDLVSDLEGGFGEKHFVDCVGQAIRVIKQRNEQVTIHGLSLVVDVLPTQLLALDGIVQTLQLHGVDVKNHVQRENDLLERLESTKKALRALEQPTTLKILCASLGITDSKLYHFNKVKKWLKAHAIEERQLRTLHTQHTALAGAIRAHDAIKDLNRSVPLVKVVDKYAGQRHEALWHYPEAKGVLKKIGEVNRARRKTEYQRETEQRDHAFAQRVPDLAEHLRSTSQKINQSSICRSFNLARSTLQHYPETRAAIVREMPNGS